MAVPRRPTAADDQTNRHQMILAVACLWPLVLLALYGASAPVVMEEGGSVIVGNSANEASSHANSNNLRLKMRDVLDRVDILGYGPTHPRVAVVIVGDKADLLVSTLESVVRMTDLSRIFGICVVADGVPEDAGLKRDLRKVEDGSIPHWHGDRPDLHDGAPKKGDADEASEAHGRLVHVVFNAQAQGVAASRADGAEFLHLLAQHHESVGIKSPHEDLILLLLEGGTQLTSRYWLTPVTNALIVPPPLLTDHSHDHVAMKLANAVAFNAVGAGQVASVDVTLAPTVTDADPDELNHSSGMSYATPAWDGAALALRLETFRNLPQQDWSLTEAWPANLDLALNLWLCADGMDMLQDVEATRLTSGPPALPLAPALAARLAASWMDANLSKQFFHAYVAATNNELTYLEWETFVAQAREEPTFTKDLPSKCRSFAWYIESINPLLADVLTQSANVEEAPAADKAPEKPVDTKPEVVPEQPTKAVDPNPPKTLTEITRKVEDVEEESVAIPPRNDKAKPTTPLRPECLEIVQKAKPVDLTFVDVSNGHKEHPHMGARGPDGQLGYIYDETQLRLNPPALSFGGEALKAACHVRDNNYRMLHDRVFVDLEADKAKTGPRDKIFCLVYTIEPGHVNIPRIKETWGPKCDGFMVASNKTDTALGTVDIVHEGPEEYNNIWQKVRSMWSYIYDNYYEKYDWFHIGGDDLFLIVENLRLYLESEEIKTAANGGIFLPDGTETSQTPLFLGRRFAYQGDMNDIFISGGSGYTMNKAALKLLVTDGLVNNFPHAHTFSEDTMVARIFRKYGVFPYETKDENGSERYMPFMPGHHWGYRLPKDISSDWYAKYSINIKEGPEHCAERSVAFHYVKDEKMYRLFALLYHLCPAEAE